ncbi:tripartite tricarboxylate transporter permease [Jonesiaceae bacterium BS-20]|uniref:Tripartite tricarboxylate transporter permease n=1 Tax=Jonesiaceae bacterium BS-20 TaxID=3120821 RepID=A0AAU7DU77_9MICO
MIDNWIAGFHAAMEPMSLLMIVVGVLAGIVIGALPGLTAVMGVAILLPFTFAMDPLPGMMMMAGLYTSAIYAGSIPAILMRVPGTPSSAASLLDGYPMARKGKSGEALSISLLSSVIGGLFGGILLALFAPMLAAVALMISQGQYFMLIFLALTMIASISEGSLLKGLLSGLLGLLIATIGTDPLTGTARLTFGIDDLRGGMDFIPVLIGLFGIAEAFNQFERRFRTDAESISKATSYKISKKSFKRMWPGVAIGSPIGFLIGALPGGTGGEVGSFISYNETRRISKDKSQFGKGDPRGLAAAETGHNSAVPGTLAPTLTMGIPGNSVAAVMIGVLTVHGLQPGPQLFTGEVSLVYGIFWGFLLVPIAVGIIGLVGIRGWGQILRIPPPLLWPGIVVMCGVGAYTIRSSVVDVFVMFLFGIIGWVMEKKNVPTIPLVIGLLVGPIAESGFRRATILEQGGFGWIFDPLTLGLLIVALLSIIVSVVRSTKLSKAAEKLEVEETKTDIEAR